MAHSHAVHLPRGALLCACTTCGAGGYTYDHIWQVVDSGTTFFFASAPLHAAMHAHLRRNAPELRASGKRVCAFMSAERRDSLPSFELVLAGEGPPLLVSPAHYMVEY